MIAPRRMVQPAPLDFLLFEDGIATKRCQGPGSCGMNKELSEFYAVSNDPNDTEGRGLCRECYNERFGGWKKKTEEGLSGKR
jgi:hypothetical protein